MAQQLDLVDKEPQRAETKDFGRVAVLTGSYPPEICGVGDYTRRLIESLRPILDVELLHVPIMRPYESNLFRVFEGRDILHIQYPTEGWGNSVLPSLLPFFRKLTNDRAKVLVTLHEWSRMNPLRRSSIRPLVAAADGFIFVSETERESFLRTAPRAARSRPMWTIPIGTNLNVPRITKQQALDRRKSLLADRSGAEHFDRLYTHFGFIHPGKQPEKLLECMGHLTSRGVRAKLLFIGGFQKDKPADEQKFRALIREMGLDRCVEFLGFISDETEAALNMAAADAGVALFDDGLSPRRGSFWYATQHGCPVITTTPASPCEFYDLAQELGNSGVQFVQPNATASELSACLMHLPPYEPFRLQPLPVPSWEDIALRHVDAYRQLQPTNP